MYEIGGCQGIQPGRRYCCGPGQAMESSGSVHGNLRVNVAGATDRVEVGAEGKVSLV